MFRSLSDSEQIDFLRKARTAIQHEKYKEAVSEWSEGHLIFHYQPLARLLILFESTVSSKTQTGRAWFSSWFVIWVALDQITNRTPKPKTLPELNWFGPPRSDTSMYPSTTCMHNFWLAL